MIRSIGLALPKSVMSSTAWQLRIQIGLSSKKAGRIGRRDSLQLRCSGDKSAYAHMGMGPEGTRSSRSKERGHEGSKDGKALSKSRVQHDVRVNLHTCLPRRAHLEPVTDPASQPAHAIHAAGHGIQNSFQHLVVHAIHVLMLSTDVCARGQRDTHIMASNHPLSCLAMIRSATTAMCAQSCEQKTGANKS